MEAGAHSMGYDFPEYRSTTSIEFTATGRPIFADNPAYDDVLHKEVPEEDGAASTGDGEKKEGSAFGDADSVALRPLHQLVRRGIVPYERAADEILHAFGVDTGHEWIAAAILKTTLPPAARWK